MIGREPTSVKAVCVDCNAPCVARSYLMAVDELDLMVFQMAVESVRSLCLSFAEKAAEIATRSCGILLFDVRVDGDAEVQRVAAIRYQGDQTGAGVGQTGPCYPRLHRQWYFLKFHCAIGNLEQHASVDAGQDRCQRPCPVSS